MFLIKWRTCSQYPFIVVPYLRLSYTIPGADDITSTRGIITDSPHIFHITSYPSRKSGQTTAPAWSENTNLASRELICAQVILKGRQSLLWCMSSHLFSTTCCLGKPNSVVRDVIWIERGNSITIGANVSARATAIPSTMKWFHLVPPVLIDSDRNGKFGR